MRAIEEERNGDSARARVTRRACNVLLVSAPLFRKPALAQVAATPQKFPPVAGVQGANPEDRLTKAVAEVRAVSDRLARVELPANIEPAFKFQA